jgi:hypothetical protein
MPDRFAAIHASASAPTDGETTPRTLRHTVFTFMIGENDTAYGRIERCRKFDAALKALRTDSPNHYPVAMQLIENWGHTGLPDRDKIPDLYPNVRDPAPRQLSWLMTDSVIKDFFWLQMPNPAKNRSLDAACLDNRVRICATNVAAAAVLLDGRLIDLHRPVVLEVNGRESKRRVKPSLRTLCETLSQRGDPELAFTVRLECFSGGEARR